MRDDIREFLVIYVKCFIIIFIMGGVLPNILEHVLNHFYSQPGTYENSILVDGKLVRPLEILYNYMHLFNSILR